MVTAKFTGSGDPSTTDSVNTRRSSRDDAWKPEIETPEADGKYQSAQTQVNHPAEVDQERATLPHLCRYPDSEHPPLLNGR